MWQLFDKHFDDFEYRYDDIFFCEYWITLGEKLGTPGIALAILTFGDYARWDMHIHAKGTKNVAQYIIRNTFSLAKLSCIEETGTAI